MASSWIKGFAAAIIIVLLSISCRKLEKQIMVTTEDPESIGKKTAILAGKITDLGEGAIQHGHIYSLTQGLQSGTLRTELGKPSATGKFQSPVNDLLPGTKYYYKAYISDGTTTVEGTVKSFTTSQITVPAVMTATVGSIARKTAQSGGDITDDGGGTITSRGVCWNTAGNPTVSDSKTTDGTGSGTYTSNLTSLQGGVTYHVRAYATNGAGTGYGNDLSFTTAAASLPTIAITNTTAITTDGLIAEANISDDGGVTITERGFCWNTSQNPVVSGDHLSHAQAGSGVFNVVISSMLPGKTYYLRAYATNSQGTAYSNNTTITTAKGQPVVSTNSNAGSITSSSVTLGGVIVSDGGASITTSGICWSTSASPTVTNSKTVDGQLSGSFTGLATSLLPCTIYHFRAYAVNSEGVGYGEDRTFTTGQITAIVNTISISNISPYSAVTGGNVSGDCSAAVTARGVCYSLNNNPTISDQKTTDGSGAGVYSSSITGLNGNTTYYVRAYAVNNAGVSYGAVLSFTTLDPAAYVTDADGNSYNTVTIGTQVWMKENLRTRKYRDNTNIPEITVSADWNALTSPGYCWYANNKSVYGDTYGALYNWYTVNTGKLCPTGWHVPNDSEWGTLISFVGGSAVAGTALKESGTVHWSSSNASTNSVGFTALPGGIRYPNGTFDFLREYGYWWSASSSNSNYMGAAETKVNSLWNSSSHGFSVRCIKD
ncbi:MAG TPA: fibrobacter succinogenes major paralogous domain-containing protein [Bacteroidales bacterium]|nr:fibrobacter succinogenes major paralogous domain-containing protein [Bacteroidales bacterium]